MPAVRRESGDLAGRKATQLARIDECQPAPPMRPLEYEHRAVGGERDGSPREAADLLSLLVDDDRGAVSRRRVAEGPGHDREPRRRVRPERVVASPREAQPAAGIDDPERVSLLARRADCVDELLPVGRPQRRRWHGRCAGDACQPAPGAVEEVDHVRGRALVEEDERDRQLVSARRESTARRVRRGGQRRQPSNGVAEPARAT